jgi:hypothetical protein
LAHGRTGHLEGGYMRRMGTKAILESVRENRGEETSMGGVTNSLKKLCWVVEF